MSEPRAFLRWAGGKTWLIRRARALFGELEFHKYHEPFLGGGSFFFSLQGARRAYLADKNGALIEVYECLRDDPQKIIEAMRPLRNTADEYYRVRDLRPNCPFERAANFIYLNQTSYNGIYRVNLKGVYNVPFGNRSKPFLDEPGLIAASKHLSGAVLKSCDFMETVDHIDSGDLVFIDPPYTVSHNRNGFIKYNQSLFSLDDQYRLAEYIRAISDAGAKFILTNAAHERIVEIFGDCGRRIELSRASLIGGKEARRGSVSEYLFTNVEVQECQS